MAKIMSTEEKFPNPNQFPVGLRVLAIDNDSSVLRNIKQMCNECRYKVITFSNAMHALDLVREKKDCIDVDMILIDIDMPNMDGYEFLKHIRKEIDVPVIVMSFDDSVSTRMEAIKQGVCDYWKKPLHKEQLRNMWMHVARKAWNDNKLETKCGSSLEDDRKKRGNYDSEFAIEAKGRSNTKESELDKAEDSHAPPPKKTRVIWTEELHNLFCKAVNKLGIENAVPKKILDAMNVPGLKRENVASHLQKHRHQIQKNQQQQNRTTKTEYREGASARIDFQEKQWINHPQGGMKHEVIYVPPVTCCPPLNSIVQPIMNEEYGYGGSSWTPSNTMNIQGNNVMMMDALHLHHHQHQHQNQNQNQNQQSLIMNLQQPSNCMMVSTNSSPSSDVDIFQGYTSPTAPSIPLQDFTSANTQVQVPYVSGSRSGDSLYQDPLVNMNFTCEYDDTEIESSPHSRGDLKIKTT